MDGDAGDVWCLLRLKHPLKVIFLCRKFMGEAFVQHSQDLWHFLLYGDPLPSKNYFPYSFLTNCAIVLICDI
ncbi:rCG51038 [Rattus norvegicus]|uniref:RCG51038 n=1 Tax=Rattus norvegicus TaxID=10116 RepID=A6KPQ4_RAT|nr:rCG51038 [Rattus norvegicus]